MKKVLLSEEINEEGLKLLEGRAEVVVAPDITEQALLKEVRDVFGIVLKSASKITRTVIESAPELRIISRTGAGYDNVDVAAATEHGILVCNLPGINSDTVAEHTTALILGLLKQIPKMDRYVREGKWAKRDEYIPRDAKGKVLGIVGFGRIGQRVAQKAKAGLEMDILVFDPYVQKDFSDEYIFCESLEELFSKSDVVTIHVPNLPSTKRMITGELLWKMKPEAYIINTSRGNIIDESALIEVLSTKRIAGAGLDVFEHEPVSDNHPFLSMDNVILSPHSAALTRECGVKMTVEAVRQVVDYLEGRIPRFIVNARGLGISKNNIPSIRSRGDGK